MSNPAPITYPARPVNGGQPRPGFHQQRCIILSPEENIALDEIIPITAYPSL